MTPTDPTFAFLIFILAFLFAYILNTVVKFKPISHPFESIDGLRGFLAISVFIHHASIWYTYLHTGKWVKPDSILFAHLGKTSVAFFFMISSFLFVQKLFEYKGDRFNWNVFYLKRIKRLVPLHLFVMSIVFLIVIIESKGVVHNSVSKIISSSMHWLSFGLFGFEDINQVNISHLNAGVYWSLTYEWLLYFSLPLVSIFIFKKNTQFIYIALSAIIIYVLIQYNTFELYHIYSFFCGAIAPIIIRYSKWNINFNNPIFTMLFIGSIAMIFQFESPNETLCKVFIGIAFTIVALGNNVAGLLKNNTLKFLGEISYSTYLLHGLLLFISINYIYGIGKTTLLSPINYCLFIFMITPILILLSYATNKHIELPFLKKNSL